MKMYKVIEATALLYGSKTLVLNKKYLNKTQSAEMKFVKSAEDCSMLGKIKNEK